VGVEGATLNGMAFTLVGGHAWWDRAGVRHNSWRGTKYYRFNGQTVALRKNGVLSYLHGDHLGSTFATTNGSGNFSGQEWYHAYGRYRGGHELGTENRFTGQKLDGAGLMYFNARYYDPELGQFLSPDTLVPDPGNLFDYNRYMYGYGNPVKFSDPSGHLPLDEIEKYFGYSPDDAGREQMIADWGEAITNQLWDTSFTWGEVLGYDGGAAMLVLFEQGDSGLYEGGFWGVSGERSGFRVLDFHLKDSGWAGKDVALSDKFAREGIAALPNHINSEYRYDYYAREYLQYGLLANLLAANTLVVGGWELGHQVYTWTGRGISKGVPTAYGVASLVADIYLAGGVLLQNYGGVTLPLIDQSLSAVYPVMATNRPYGMGPAHLGGNSPPAGVYK